MKHQNLCIRLSEDEKAQISDHVQSLGSANVSEWARLILLKVVGEASPTIKTTTLVSATAIETVKARLIGAAKTWKTMEAKGSDEYWQGELESSIAEFTTDLQEYPSLPQASATDRQTVEIKEVWPYELTYVARKTGYTPTALLRHMLGEAIDDETPRE